MTSYIKPRHRSRRLRKKLRVGEFQELGFEFEARLKEAITSEEETDLIDTFISEIVEPRALAFGGGLEGGFVASCRRGSVSEGDRAAVHSWLSARQEVNIVTVGPLIDAWFPLEESKASE